MLPVSARKRLTPATPIRTPANAVKKEAPRALAPGLQNARIHQGVSIRGFQGACHASTTRNPSTETLVKHLR